MYSLTTVGADCQAKPESTTAGRQSFSATTYLSDCDKDRGIDLKSYPIILAVSGGRDSMAMAGHVKAWHDCHGRLPLCAVIVDHGLRDESSREAQFVKACLEAMGIDAKIRVVEDKPRSQGVQAWAREKRYALLAEEARLYYPYRRTVVMTAHHARDQAETVAMRLAAGSGLAGLAGMQKQTTLHDMRLLRPFLEVMPEKLHHILGENDIPYIEDPSNSNEQFERVALRARLDALGQEEITISGFLKLGDLSQRLMTAFNSHLSATMTGRCAMTTLGVSWFKRTELLALPEPALLLFLRQIVRESGRSRSLVSLDAVAVLRQKLADKDNDGIVATLGGLEWHLRKEIIWVYAEAELDSPDVECDAGRVLYDGVWKIALSVAGILHPLGSRAAAEFRKRSPESFEKMTAIECDGMAHRMPQRALWRLPVFSPASTTPELSQGEGLITLEDGAIIPHVLKDEDFNASLPLRTTMCHNRTGGLIFQ
jgi:tRNA(Ile)-lysidine synthetase-like protein